MKKPVISMIAALAKENRAIGKSNALLWKISEDLDRFRRITTGHPIIMGRKTYESIGRPLPNRTNIVITRNPDFKAPDCITVQSLDMAIEKAKNLDSEEIFIIGGGQIFTEGIKIADKLYLTLVEGTFDGDVFFPNYSKFKTVLHEEKGQSNGYAYTFIDLAR